MHPKAKEYISKLQLEQHPEGGYFKEIYRCGELFSAEHLPGRYNKDRSFSTSIYFMLEGNQVSLFHKLKSDEVWHFYDGTAIIVYIITEDGEFTEQHLGNNIDKGESFQIIIPKGSWFGAELKDELSFGLIGCTVSPGFDFEDFELGSRKYLLKLYPKYSEIIKKLTKFDI